MSHFRPINESASSSASATHHAPSPPSRPDIAGIVGSKQVDVPHGSASRPPSTLRDRQFTLIQAIDKTVFDGELHYRIRWKESLIVRSLLKLRQNGSAFVLIEEQPWEVRRYTDAGEDKHGWRFCWVVWDETWMWIGDLQNAQEAIEEFEAELLRRRHGSEVASSSTDARPSIESGGTLPPVDLAWPRQGTISHVIFQPQPGLDYRLAWREAVQKSEGEDSLVLEQFPQEQDKRPLLLRGEFCNRSRFNGTRPEMKRAAFVLISGIEQHRQCECCQKLQGPFTKCVVAANTTQGPCANCASTKGRKCNFHPNSFNERWQPALDSAAPARVPSSSPSRPSRASSVSHSPAAQSSPERQVGRDSTPLSDPPSPLRTPSIFARQSSASASHRKPVETAPASTPFGSRNVLTNPAKRPTLATDAQEQPGARAPLTVIDLLSPTASSPSSSEFSFPSPSTFVRPRVAASAKERPNQDVLSSASQSRLNIAAGAKDRRPAARLKRTASSESLRLDSEADGPHPVSCQPPKQLKLSNREGKKPMGLCSPASLPARILSFRPSHERGVASNVAAPSDSLIAVGSGSGSAQRRPIRPRRIVYSDQRFRVGEATSAQLEYVLCRAREQAAPTYPEQFEEGWRLSWFRKKCNPTLEELHSRWYTDRLNEAIPQVCPRRPTPPQGMEIIAIDSDSD